MDSDLQAIGRIGEVVIYRRKDRPCEIFYEYFVGGRSVSVVRVGSAILLAEWHGSSNAHPSSLREFAARINAAVKLVERLESGQHIGDSDV